MTDLLKKLTLADAPSGFEDEVRELIRKEAEPYADEITEDAMGNLIVSRRADSASKKKPITLAAHIDEVGVILTEHTGGGFYKFDFAGGVDVRVALGKRVRLLTSAGKKDGIISPGKAWHLMGSAERKRVPKVAELFIDAFGNESAKPGDYAAFNSDYSEFGNGFVKAKALDDRSGCAVLLTLLKEKTDRDAYYVFTVQEEVGCRGAQTAANRLDCDTVIVVESTTAADYPSREGGEKVCVLGNGAVLPFMDGGTIYDRKLWTELTAIADRQGIKWQTKTRIAGGTDARSFQRGGHGAKVAAISLPTRNIHSPSCVGKLSDLDCVLNLCRAAVESIGV
ncbi:MAG: M42 family peptidase [Oscillospiraceae bacterium]|jgi:endoglucanase|nr:M42 family peptidase [Oscillospiraceae bacterium]